MQTTVLPGIDILQLVVSELAVPTPELSLMMSLVSPRLLSVTPSASTELDYTNYDTLHYAICVRLFYCW